MKISISRFSLKFVGKGLFGLLGFAIIISLSTLLNNLLIQTVVAVFGYFFVISMIEKEVNDWIKNLVVEIK